MSYDEERILSFLIRASLLFYIVLPILLYCYVYRGRSGRWIRVETILDLCFLSLRSQRSTRCRNWMFMRRVKSKYGRNSTRTGTSQCSRPMFTRLFEFESKLFITRFLYIIFYTHYARHARTVLGSFWRIKGLSLLGRFRINADLKHIRLSAINTPGITC